MCRYFLKPMKRWSTSSCPPPLCFLLPPAPSSSSSPASSPPSSSAPATPSDLCVLFFHFSYISPLGSALDFTSTPLSVRTGTHTAPGREGGGGGHQKKSHSGRQLGLARVVVVVVVVAYSCACRGSLPARPRWCARTSSCERPTAKPPPPHHRRDTHGGQRAALGLWLKQHAASACLLPPYLPTLVMRCFLAISMASSGCMSSIASSSLTHTVSQPVRHCQSAHGPCDGRHPSAACLPVCLTYLLATSISLSLTMDRGCSWSSTSFSYSVTP